MFRPPQSFQGNCQTCCRTTSPGIPDHFLPKHHFHSPAFFLTRGQQSNADPAAAKGDDVAVEEQETQPATEAEIMEQIPAMQTVEPKQKETTGHNDEQSPQSEPKPSVDLKASNEPHEKSENSYQMQSSEDPPLEAAGAVPETLSHRPSTGDDSKQDSEQGPDKNKQTSSDGNRSDESMQDPNPKGSELPQANIPSPQPQTPVPEPAPSTVPVPVKQEPQQDQTTTSSNLQQCAGVGKGGVKRGPEEEANDDEFVTKSRPPEPLSTNAISCRLRRVFNKRKDGSTLLDDRWNTAWKDIHGGGRDQLLAMFEKVGYDPDRVEQMPCRQEKSESESNTESQKSNIIFFFMCWFGIHLFCK